jgi:hypothetical protein
MKAAPLSRSAASPCRCGLVQSKIPFWVRGRPLATFDHHETFALTEPPDKKILRRLPAHSSGITVVIYAL